jgi:hypothetical protein
MLLAAPLGCSVLTLWITVTRVNLKIASPHYYIGQAQSDPSDRVDVRAIFN